MFLMLDTLTKSIWEESALFTYCSIILLHFLWFFLAKDSFFSLDSSLADSSKLLLKNDYYSYHSFFPLLFKKKITLKNAWLTAPKLKDTCGFCHQSMFFKSSQKRSHLFFIWSYFDTGLYIYPLILTICKWYFKYL